MSSLSATKESLTIRELRFILVFMGAAEVLLTGSGIRKRREGYRDWLSACARHFSERTASNHLELFVGQRKLIEVDCYLVRREMVNWMEGDLTEELRTQIDLHLRNCEHCTAIYDGARNVVQLLGNEKAIELPPGFSKRLYVRLFRTQ